MPCFPRQGCLAKTRQEEEEEGGKEPESTPAEESTPRPRQTSPAPVAPPPAPPASDWFSTATSAPPASGSSLRVGRTKISRNHIQRPSRPSKARFSAVYEEDADDAMDDDETRQKEREMLEEAAKKAPVFNIPADFSFAKDVSNLLDLLYFLKVYTLSRHLLSSQLIWTRQRSRR